MPIAEATGRATQSQAVTARKTVNRTRHAALIVGDNPTAAAIILENPERYGGIMREWAQRIAADKGPASDVHAARGAQEAERCGEVNNWL